MSIRTRHGRRHRRAGATVATAVAAAALLASCSGDSKPPALSESGLHDTSRAAAKETKKCPVDYDLDKAAAAAHLSQHATPVSAVASLRENADKDAVVSTMRGTDLECTYRLGTEELTVYTVAVQKGDAVTMLAPVIQMRSQMSSTELGTYLRLVLKTPTGTPVVTPRGNVASVRLRGAGSDTAALVLSCGGDGDTKLTSKQVRTLAGELAGQADW